MNTTGIFTIHRHIIPYKKYGEPIYLIPFGDIHRSSPQCHEEKWTEFLGWARRKKRCYFLGMGDYDDLASASERHILTDRKLHDSTRTTLEDIYRKFTDRFAKEIGFMDGNLIGLLEGNHYGEFENGTTTTQRLCERLHCKYLGVSSFIRLSFEMENYKTGKRKCIDIWAHHGKGAARLIGGSLNRVEQMAECAEADIYLMGHDHKKSQGNKTRLRLTDGGETVRLSHRKILIARTGSFLKGYVPETKSYIVDMALNPTDLGVIKIELTPRLTGDNYDRVEIDLHASL
jgi:UDP-2,3-diacylglucosamine pyrophosphatase LpxH